ncbi:type I restriction-modification enzyme R subunit C-terminal domain-containing protein [Haloferula sargassicola]|uniref:EcoEI R protein C-terminal domain-containing protein n=1 Tax=Haloferula sargassicola TaxID=490096 RepID=A0ABP9URZ3_9BACT
MGEWSDQIAGLGRGETPEAPSPRPAEILAPLAIESLREKILALRGYSPVLIDILSQDEAEAPVALSPRRTIDSFEAFLEENRDRLLALQILYHQSPGPGALTYEVIRELRDALAQPPYHLAPEAVWQAYAALEKTTPATPPAKVLTNLITLVRHTVDPEHQPLAPFPELVNERFDTWLAQQQHSASGGAADSSLKTENLKLKTPRFTESQVAWLKVIRDTVALNGAFPTDEQEDYLEAWQNVDSKEGVPLAVARKAFGADPKPIIEELNTVLVA